MHLWSVISPLFFLTVGILGNVRLNFTVQNYENKNDLDIRLRKCESFSFLGDHCDPLFQLTVHAITTESEKRLILKKESGPFKNMKFVKRVLDVSSTQSAFPTSLEIELDIHDSDVDEDQRIARFRRHVPLSGTGQIDLHMGSDVRVSVIVALECISNFYGDRCSVYCRSVPNMWTCNNVTGVRTCSKPCAHGSCVLTSTSADCVCSFGWSGEFCAKPSESRLIDSMLLIADPTEFAREEFTSAKKERLLSEHARTTKATVTASDTAATTASVSSTEFPHTTRATTPFSNALSSSTTVYQHSNLPNLTDGHVQHETVQEVRVENGTRPIAAATLEHDHAAFIIPLSTLIVIAIWAFIMVGTGILCYRRQKSKNGSSYSESMWTNAMYNSTRECAKRPYCWEYAPAPHKYENTINSVKTTPTLLSISSRLSSNASTRGALPRIPPNEHAQLGPPPIITGSKIRFAATTVSALPSNYKHSGGLLHRTHSFKGKSVLSDPYEELSDDNDYCIWEQDLSIRTPLTTFQKNDKMEVD